MPRKAPVLLAALLIAPLVTPLVGLHAQTALLILS
jgi:DNA-binding beta-propeller fold protein YncE